MKLGDGRCGYLWEGFCMVKLVQPCFASVAFASGGMMSFSHISPRQTSKSHLRCIKVFGALYS